MLGKEFDKDNFESKIELIPFHECWEWVASKTGMGYGNFWFNKKSVAAHRLSYELYVGDIPVNGVVCHSCDNPGCVNPRHLFVGTQKDNIRDCLNKKRLYIAVGESNKSSKLKNKDIVEIRYKYLSNKYSMQELGDLYEVKRLTIFNIIHRISWKHV